MTRSRHGSFKLQSSFELLVTLSFGLAILLPLVVLAFVQLANANTSLSTIEAQQSASKLANIATIVGGEGPPAKQLVQIQVPPNIQYIYVGSSQQGVIGHEIIFVVRAPTGLSYVTSYTPVNVSGSLGGIVAPGTYLVNLTAQSVCPNSNTPAPCVYLSPVI